MLLAPPPTRPLPIGAPPLRPHPVDTGSGRVRVAMGRQLWAMVAAVATVVGLDQLSKAWAWRHLTEVSVNSGGDMLVSPAVSDLFRDRIVGAVFDVVDAALIVAALLLLARRHRPAGVLPAGSLLLAGWLSNLADRLGMHYWTAPGSVRGAVDFAPFAGYLWNLADLAIIVGASWLLLALVVAGVRRGISPAARSHPGLARRPLQHGWVRVALVVGVLVVAMLAAAGAYVGGYGDSPGAVLAARGY